MLVAYMIMQKCIEVQKSFCFRPAASFFLSDMRNLGPFMNYFPSKQYFDSSKIFPLHIFINLYIYIVYWGSVCTHLWIISLVNNSSTQWSVPFTDEKHSRICPARGRGEKCGRLGQHLDISWLVRLQFSMFYQHIWWYHPICKQDTKRTFAKSKFYLCWWKINWTFFWFSLNFTIFSSTFFSIFSKLENCSFHRISSPTSSPANCRDDERGVDGHDPLGSAQWGNPSGILWQNGGTPIAGWFISWK